MDFTAAWAANFAASLTLSLLGLVARGPAPRNIARDSRVELVVYDSSRLPGETAAVYVTGTAVESRPTSSRRRAPGVRCTYASDPSYGTGMDTRLVVPPG